MDDEKRCQRCDDVLAPEDEDGICWVCWDRQRGSN